MIVVVDTNVWISGLHFAERKGIPAKALERAINRDQIAVCPEIEAEIYRVLTNRFKWNANEAAETVGNALANALYVRISGRIMGCRDVGDDMFLECARLASADLIVAGDKDLLVLERFGNTRIVTPAQYLLEG